MERPTGAELRSSPKANRNAGSVYNKLTQPKTFPGRGRSPPKNLSRKERKGRKETSREVREVRKVLKTGKVQYK